MGRLSFAIALNLITDGFKKGAKEVKTGINSIKATAMSVAAYFGVGFLGITAVFDKIKEAGLQTAKAIEVLKANSGGIVQTGQNLRFVQGIADKYKLEITSLITEYSKFTAAATTAGFSVKQQQTIFEGVQKAMKGYKLDEEASSTVMQSLQKMMNTGAISTRNFTNSFLRAMPQAKQALADAVGVSVDKLNDLVKKGIATKGVMESFAKNLQNMSPSVKTDDLVSAKNRISNAFSSIAQDTGIVKWLAVIANKVADLIDYVRKNARSLVCTISGLLAGIKISQFFAQWKVFSKVSSDAMVTNATVAHSKVRMLESGTARLKRQIAAEEVNIDKLSGDERLAAEVQLSAKKKQLANNELALAKAKNTARVADERAAAVQSGNAWEATWAKIKTGATSLATSLKAVWATVGPMILISLVTELIAKFVEWKAKADQIKNAFKDYRAEASKAVHTREITELEELKQQYDHAKKNSRERLDLEKRIGDVTGQHVTGERNINKLLDERISLLQTAAEIEFYTNKKLELQDRQSDLRRKYGGNAPGSKKSKEYFYNPKNKSFFEWLNPFSGNDFSNDINEYAANTRTLSDTEKKLASAEARAGKTVESYTPERASDVSIGGDKKKKKADPAEEELENAERQYSESLTKIALSEKIGLTTSEQANKARQELVISTYSELATSKYPKVRASAFTQTLGAKYRQIEINKPLSDLNTIAGDYYKKLDDLKKQFSSGAITQNEYVQSIADLIAETRKSMALLPDMTGKSKKYVGALFDLSSSMQSTQNSLVQKLPVEKERDTTFDYKKTGTDILSEQLENAKKQLDDLNSKTVQKTKQMVDAINDQMSKVTKLSDALKLAEVKKDVEDFSKDLKEKTWGGIRDIADGSDRILSSWQQLGQTLSSADASGWEKIMAIWQTLEDSVDSIFNIINAIGEWTKASKDLKAAQAAEAAATVSANAVKSASTVAATAVSTAASETEANENRKTVAGNVAAAGSEVIKQNAKIPFVGIALAAAGLIAILGLFGKLPKFALGGIVGGSSTSGDNMLARVNSGEMILNGSQQKKLFSAINTGNVGGAQQSIVSTKVRGEDMYLAIKNYMRSKNKSW